MSSSDVIALVSVLVSPTAALVAVWLTSLFAARQRSAEVAATTRAEALQGFSRFAALALDSEPTLISSGSIREYVSPAEAVAGLYARWVTVREPMVLLAFAHPSEEVRHLALNVQAQLELALRRTEDAIKSDGDVSLARDSYQQCVRELSRLGGLLGGTAARQLG